MASTAEIGKSHLGRWRLAKVTAKRDLGQWDSWGLQIADFRFQIENHHCKSHRKELWLFNLKSASLVTRSAALPPDPAWRHAALEQVRWQRRPPARRGWTTSLSPAKSADECRLCPTRLQTKAPSTEASPRRRRLRRKAEPLPLPLSA